ncbi:type IV pilin protein [Xanthomonas theicola]|uniref:Pilus assembly protein PilE n=1 Tax=Xanthomonas theicola TaxID=56464 RepID=A0A2S6Z6Y6_9XANT|nr:type IV pilin protein [Xanthomonas theicola]PPT77360.1 pilus assembly protein PilE [Xanthomonas theicola]QNH25016.1 type IV pilin protein [Xanthomonas theicola]
MRPLLGSPSRQHGFTLIEIMIVVLIVGVLAAIAFASYESYVVKSRRAAAAVCLQQGAQLMERYYTTAKMSYVGATEPTCDPTLSQFYKIGFNDVPPTQNAFRLSAIPLGRQKVKDTKCGTLGLDQKGARTTSTGALETECW